MNLYQPRVSLFLTKRLKSLNRYETIDKVELYNQILESYIKFSVWVGEICNEGEIAIEILRRVKVDDVEVCIWSIKNRISWFNYEKDDQSSYPQKDDEEREY